MGCNPFANYRFQMGVTVMGFAEHFGLSLLDLSYLYRWCKYLSEYYLIFLHCGACLSIFVWLFNRYLPHLSKWLSSDYSKRKNGSRMS